MPVLIYIPHLDGNVLVLHPLLTEQSRNTVNLSFCGTFSITISQPSSALSIGRYAKAAHVLQIIRTLHLTYLSLTHAQLINF